MCKLTELKDLMGYFELVSFTGNGKEINPHWLLRNVTDEGLGQEVPFSTVRFSDTNLDDLLDRAINYAKFGPSKEIIKAALEVTAIFGKRTIVQGDVIAIMYDSISDPESAEIVENKGLEMRWKYGKFELDLVHVNGSLENKDG
jgi:hypothetical protein